MGKTKLNIIYNMIYQVLSMIIPLITAPYLARTVGAEGVGTYSYTYSIVYYFMLLTLLGVNNYGNRSIAKTRDDIEKRSKTFWSIYFLQLIMGIIMITIYLIYVLAFDNLYKNIALIQSLFIVSAMLDINWFFFGLEEFKKTITRNSFVKIGNALLIFLLIKSRSDVWKYTLIMSGMTCLSQIILWGFLKKHVKITKITLKDIKKHIKPNLILFIPVIAISLYKMMDKIMLGALTTVKEVGFYENAEKIINIPMLIISAIGTVMLPKMSNMIAKNNFEHLKVYIEKTIKFVSFLSIGMFVGLFTIGKHFSVFFFGAEFYKSGSLIMLLSITMPFLAFANVLRTQYLIPNEKDKIYVKSVFIGAVINMIMNFVFIPKYESIGACFGTIAAEFSVMFYQSWAVRKELPIKEYIANSIPFLIEAIIMLIVIYPFNYVEMSSLVRLIIQVGLGCIVYGLLNIKYILSIVDIKKIINKIFKKKSIS